MFDAKVSPPTLIDKSSLTPEQYNEWMAAVVQARVTLARWDPMGEPMEVLALAGIHSAKVSGTTSTGMRFVVEGGAPKPPKARKR